ncbi:MAG: HNH endonuclease, partial [Sphingobacteriaceae bacterium]
MPRDNFNQQTINSLARRVGYLCSNPFCEKHTSGPHVQPDKVTSIGVAAHITAASPQGPRYDSNLTTAQRSSIKNGIWLCASCSTLIDKDNQEQVGEESEEAVQLKEENRR